MNSKKENILVWLDFDAYSYVNFGIANSLSKNKEFNLIGIVTTKQDISFFKNQNILKFEKIITELKNTKLIEDEDTCNNQESEEIERELKKLGYL